MRKKDNIAIKSIKGSNVKLLKGKTQNMQLQSRSKYLFVSITEKINPLTKITIEIISQIKIALENQNRKLYIALCKGIQRDGSYLDTNHTDWYQGQRKQ